MAAPSSLAYPYPITWEWIRGIAQYDTWMTKKHPFRDTDMAQIP